MTDKQKTTKGAEILMPKRGQERTPPKPSNPSKSSNPAPSLDQLDDDGFEDALMSAAQKYNREHPPPTKS